MFPINEIMGQYSELFMLLAAGTYTVAFIAFAWDLAKSSKALRAVDLRVAEAAAGTGAAAKVTVGAGVGAGGASGGYSYDRGESGVDAADADRTGGTLPGRRAVPSGRRRPSPQSSPAAMPGWGRQPTLTCATQPSAVHPPVWPWR